MSQWIFKMSFSGSNADMEMHTPLVSGIVNNVLFHSVPHISQMLHQIIRILHFLSDRFVAELCPRFCSQFDWGQGSSAARNLDIHSGDEDLLDYCTFRVETVNDVQNVWVNTACGKKIVTVRIKLILWYRNVYNQIARYVCRNQCYKLTTDKLHPVN